MDNSDFLLDDEGDLLIVNGDLVIGDSDQQHVYDLLTCPKGNYKEHSTIGIHALDYRNKTGDVSTRFQRDVKEELKRDGFARPKMTMINGLEDFKVEV